jgi:cardiolipin synthase
MVHEKRHAEPSDVSALGLELPRISVGIGLVVEAIALALIPLVLLRKKEPSSTAAWILALVFLPGIGATLFLLFGRDRLRIPVQDKPASDRAVTRRSHRHHSRTSAALVKEAPATMALPDRELFRVASALASAEALPDNDVELLVDGNAAYEAIGRAIDAAEHHVHAEYYLVREGKTADWFAERLAAAAARGVRVRLLLDGYGSFWISRRWVRSLRAAGVEVAFFLPARLIFFQPMNLRNHRKIVVVDGDTAFTGGINVGDEYRGAEGPWRDTHLAVRGPAASALARVFAQDWEFATRRTIETEQVACVGAPRAHGAATVAIVRSGPDIEGTERETIHRVFFSAITLARSSVHITTPYFIPDRSIVVALQTAALRGVDVKLLFPGKSNHPVVWQAGRSFYEELLEAGVALYEYGPGMIHAKTMVVDGSIALVGSANMDLRSFRLNFEVHAVVRDEATAARLDACFADDLAVSRRIDPAAFQARGASKRVFEGVARFLSPLM